MYRAILFSPDGEDWVTDFRRETVEEVWSELADMGSRWYFYPICAVIRDGPVIGESKRIVDGCDTESPFYFNTRDFRGRPVRSVLRALKTQAKQHASA